jgi:hypothetical protein
MFTKNGQEPTFNWIRWQESLEYAGQDGCRSDHVSGDLKLYQYRQCENGRFSSWYPERKKWLSSPFSSYLRRWQGIVRLHSEPHGKFGARKMLHFHFARFGTFPRSR